MKISIFSAFYPFRGGISQFSAPLVRSLEKKNSVKPFTFKRQYPSFLFPGETQFVSETDTVDKIPAVRILDSINPFSYFRAARTINKEKSDLFITNYWMSFFGPAFGIISRRINKKTKQISILHNVIPHEKRFFDTLFNRFFLKKTDGFVVMSDTVLNDLLSIQPTAKYLRIDHPVYRHFGDKIDKDEALKKLNLLTDKKTLLFFGLIRDYKGLDLLIEAMNLLDDSYQLLIAGEVYGSFEKYAELIKTSKAANRIHLHNQYIPDSDVSFYFSASDACILPYKNATQSGITAVSNHFSLPIIATDVGGLKETISHLKTGIIVNEPKTDLISEAIQYYFAHNLKESFAENIEIENKEKSWDNFTEKLIEFYHSL